VRGSFEQWAERPIVAAPRVGRTAYEGF
jgi:hypothetical protein